MTPDQLVAHCIEAGVHLRGTHRFVGEPFDRCHGCSQPVVVEPPPGWKTEGLCLQADPEVFWPTSGATAEQAKAICGDCPVIVECGAYALLHEPDGIWGGMAPRDRQAIRAQLGITLRTPAGPYDHSARDTRIRSLAEQGLRPAEIAAETGIHPRTIQRALQGVAA